jgi:hypothetical protein
MNIGIQSKIVKQIFIRQLTKGSFRQEETDEK